MLGDLPTLLFFLFDDLTAINDEAEHERSLYSPQLELKKENIDYFEGSFLDF